LRRVIAAVWQSFEADDTAIAEHRFNQVRKIANSFIFDYHDEIADSTARQSCAKSSSATRRLSRRYRAEETDHPELLKESAIAYRKIGDAQGKPYMRIWANWKTR
jgi:hypothetical protein